MEAMENYVDAAVVSEESRNKEEEKGHKNRRATLIAKSSWESVK